MKFIIFIVVLLLFFVGIPTMLFKSCDKVTNDLQNEKNWYKERVGKQYIVNKDTFIIIDYNRLTETFKLSNGLEINKSLIK